MGVGLLRFTRILTLAATALAAEPTLAEDLIAKPALPESTPQESWTGVHAGISIGARLSDTTWTTDCLAPEALPATCPNDNFGGGTRIGNDNPASFDNDVPRVGAYLGFDWQVARLVLGIEGEAAWADDSRTHAGIPGTWSTDFGPDTNTARIESAWDASVRARAGFLLTPKTLVYSTGGLALLHYEVSASCGGTFPVGWCVVPNADSESVIAVGWTAGGGVERMLSHAWIVRGEYRYSDYGSQSFTLFEDEALDSVGITIERRASLVSVGVTRKF